jgi:hypothetical protein
MTGQSRAGSLAEAVTNIAVGIGVAYVSQLIIFGAYGIAVSLTLNIVLTFWFTVVSLARQFVLRRLFNWLTIRRDESKECPNCGRQLSDCNGNCIFAGTVVKAPWINVTPDGRPR